jgi:hypothetical protein
LLPRFVRGGQQQFCSTVEPACVPRRQERVGQGGGQVGFTCHFYPLTGNVEKGDWTNRDATPAKTIGVRFPTGSE